MSSLAKITHRCNKCGRKYVYVYKAYSKTCIKCGSRKAIVVERIASNDRIQDMGGR